MISFRCLSHFGMRSIVAVLQGDRTSDSTVYSRTWFSHVVSARLADEGENASAVIASGPNDGIFP